MAATDSSPAQPSGPASDSDRPTGSSGDPVTVTSVETLHCDAGWRNYHFCKITTDEGIDRAQ